MSPLLRLLPVLVAGGLLVWAQSAPPSGTISTEEEFFDIYAEHPRLFLSSQRLRLLRRERERRTMRWLQFETLVQGGAPMPEPGFAYALFYQASHAESVGRKAVDWALSPKGGDLRQLALVFDWCQPLLSQAEQEALAAKLRARAGELEKDTSLPGRRSQTLAMAALAGHNSFRANRFFEKLVKDWWRGEIAPALKAGRDVIPRDDAFPLLEILHVVRDNLQIDLREDVPFWFKELPIYHLLSYYPASYPASENEYRIPALKRLGEPDTRRALFSRAAELAMVAFETNAPETQVLQGWLMHDRFLLRGPLGIPYEFLWANPYQPGLSYYHIPLVHHDPKFGRLFVRSSWEEDAVWLGYWDGQLQIFQEGSPANLKLDASQPAVSFPDVLVATAGLAAKCEIRLEEDQDLLIVGLKPDTRYEFEVEDHELFEMKSDAGGIVHLKLPRNKSLDFRAREATAGQS
jgi:hypothetical protein